MPDPVLLVAVAILLLPVGCWLVDFFQHRRLLQRLKAGWGQPETLRGLDADELADVKHYYQQRIQHQPPVHPLVEHAVANDFDWQRKALVSGSNASGKSTFIKAVAVNAILAQTIGFCWAQSFAMRRGQVMTAMAVRDNLLSGESYFVVEIKSLKRILDAADGPIYAFIDEILRGTNTIERIAASSAVLRALSTPTALCMAATHDIELTRLLADAYENLHFSETVDENGIGFDYRLKPGPTKTRNALRLLQQMGYAPGIITQAQHSAQRFEQTGTWR